MTGDGRTARLAVRDTGVGMTPYMLERVFDLFVQGERTLDRAEGGLGIGLTLVRRLVEMHGGRVEADESRTGPRHHVHGGAARDRGARASRPAAAARRARARGAS